MANGFLTETPADHGDTQQSIPSDHNAAIEFTCPGSGTQELTEIGCFGNGDGHPQGGDVYMGVFTDDVPNDCPDAIVADSDSGETTMPQNGPSISHSYGTLPEVTGGAVYWLAIHSAEGRLNIDMLETGANSINLESAYPAWPTPTEWETHFNRSWDLGLWAVYQAAAAGRTTRNTDAWPLGQNHGMSFRTWINN